MPARAGVQEDPVLASNSASWIPGLALLARNDVPAASPSSLLWWSTSLSVPPSFSLSQFALVMYTLQTDCT